MKKLLIIASLAAACSAPAAAFQSELGQAVLVRYADLDLSTLTGRAELDRRVKRAVRRACDSGEPRGASDVARIAACKDRASRDAGRQIEIATANPEGSRGKSYLR